MSFNAKPGRSAGRRRLVGAASAIAAIAGGCSQAELAAGLASTSLGNNTPVAAKDSTWSAETIKPGSIGDLARAHAEKPKDAKVALAYARSLRASGKQREALAVLEGATEAAPGDRMLKVEQGMLALELGHADRAKKLLQATSAAEGDDWRLLSALGVAHASLGQQPEAQRWFAKALKASPNNPAVLNNLALSYALEGRANEAESLLRRASSGSGSNPRIAQNLALASALRTEAAATAGTAPGDGANPAEEAPPPEQRRRVAIE